MSDENDYADAHVEPPVESTPPKQFWGMNLNTYCMLMHLSILLGYSGFGIAVPIVLWAVNKDQSQVIDQHGKNLMNFLVTVLICAFASIPLLFVGVGIVTIIVVGIISIVFPIIAAVKANDGIFWKGGYVLCSSLATPKNR